MSDVSYSYNASAIGLGGTIRKGNRTTVVPSLASVCLASAGGEGSACVENYYKDDISFSRAESRVAGYSVARGFRGRRHYTYADVFISNLKIFDRLKIALMQATVTSTRDIDSDNPFTELLPDSTRFSVRVIYRGIEVDGEEVVPDVDWDLCHAETYDNFTRLLKSREHVPAGIKNLLGGGAEQAVQAPEVIDAETAATELIRRRPQVVVDRDRPPISGPLVSFPGKGNGLKLGQFGKARFGDLIVKPDRQRVSLLRLNLDSDWIPSSPDSTTQRFSLALNSTTDDGSDGGDGGGGDVTSGDGGSNGVPIWTQG